MADSNQDYADDDISADAQMARARKYLAAPSPEVTASAPAPGTSSPTNPPIPQRPTTGVMLRKAGETLSGASPGAWGGSLSDPAIAGAVLGAGAGTYYSGASLNPFKPTFMQRNPRFSGVTPTPHSTYVQPAPAQGAMASTQGAVESPSFLPEQTVIDLGSDGTTRQLTNNQGIASGVSNASKHAIETGQAALEDFNASRHVGTPRAPINPIGAAGPQSFRNLVYRPLSTQLQLEREAAEAAQAAPTVLGAAQQVGTPTVSDLIPGALAKAFPGLSSAGEWVKGALPTVGIVLRGAATGLGVGDALARAYQHDWTGAGISAGGTALTALAGSNPYTAIPTALGATALQYLHDHPGAIDSAKAYLNSPGGQYSDPSMYAP